MNELKNTGSIALKLRWQLLATVSAASLLVSVSGLGSALASGVDEDRPTVWLELGGQMDHISGQGDSFTPNFVVTNSASPVLQAITPLQAQRAMPFNFGGEGKLSLQPAGSDWTFSASVYFGRSSNRKHVDHQTNALYYRVYKYGVPPHPTLRTVVDFADTQVHRRQNHAVLDFYAGKDVGLGLFGKDASSTLNFGVRIAQFESAETFDVRALPDRQFKTISLPSYHVTIKEPYFHTYHATGAAARSVRAMGPSVSWAGTIPILGNSQDGGVAVDLGLNAALLFGRQKAHVRHHQTAHYVSPNFNAPYYQPDYQRSGGHDNARSITVPNFGAFAGATYRVENFKVSMGYRADFFFGANDGGIATPKDETLGFFGPFATISVGLGG